VAPHALDNLVDDGEAQASAFMVMRGALKHAEYAGLGSQRDAGAIVFDRDADEVSGGSRVESWCGDLLLLC